MVTVTHGNRRVPQRLRKSGEDDIIGGERCGELAKMRQLESKTTNVGFSAELIRTKESERESSATS